MDTILQQQKIPRQLQAQHRPQGCCMFCMPRVLPSSESPECSGCVEKGRGHTGNMNANKWFPRQVVSVLFPFSAEHLPARTPTPRTCSQCPLQHHSSPEDGLQECPNGQRPRLGKKSMEEVRAPLKWTFLSWWSPVSLDWTKGRQRRPTSPERHHVHLPTSKQNQFWCNYSWWNWVLHVHKHF